MHIYMAPQKDLIQKVWLALSSEHNDYFDRWICDETWCLAFKTYYPSLMDAVNFDRGQLKRALNSKVGLLMNLITEAYMKRFSIWIVHTQKRRGQSHSITAG